MASCLLKVCKETCTRWSKRAESTHDWGCGHWPGGEASSLSVDRFLLRLCKVNISRTVGNLIGHIKTSIKQNNIFLQLSLRNKTPCKKTDKSRLQWTNRCQKHKSTQIVSQVTTKNVHTNTHVHAELERHTYQPTLIYDQTSPIRDRVETHSWNADTRAPHQRF